jgi:hypothetical protein
MTQPSTSILAWEPGGEPSPSTTQAELPAITWIDYENETPLRMIAAAEPLDLPGLHAQYLRHLFSNIDPGDSIIREDDDFDPEIAAQLERSNSIHLLQAVEPVAVEYQDENDPRWSFVICRIGFLVGETWLVTYRARPWDARFGGSDDLPPTPRQSLVEACREFERTDQKPIDIAMLMLHHLGKRSLTVARELNDEIGNRMVDFHRGLVTNPADEQLVQRVRNQLFDLRWALDAFERAIRRLAGDSDRQVDRWYLAGSDQAQVANTRKLFERSLLHAQNARRELAEALVWMTTENNSRTLDKQAEFQKDAASLQRLVGLVSVYLLGPALIAAIFGAFPNWLASDPTARAALMFGLIALVAFGGWLILRRLGGRPDEAVGPLGTPVHGWALRFGAQLNRAVRKAGGQSASDE